MNDFFDLARHCYRRGADITITVEDSGPLELDATLARDRVVFRFGCYDRFETAFIAREKRSTDDLAEAIDALHLPRVAP